MIEKDQAWRSGPHHGRRRQIKPQARADGTHGVRPDTHEDPSRSGPGRQGMRRSARGSRRGPRLTSSARNWLRPGEYQTKFVQWQHDKRCSTRRLYKNNAIPRQLVTLRTTKQSFLHFTLARQACAQSSRREQIEPRSLAWETRRRGHPVRQDRDKAKMTCSPADGIVISREVVPGIFTTFRACSRSSPLDHLCPGQRL